MSVSTRAADEANPRRRWEPARWLIGAVLRSFADAVRFSRAARRPRSTSRRRRSTRRTGALSFAQPGRLERRRAAPSLEADSVEDDRVGATRDGEPHGDRRRSFEPERLDPADDLDVRSRRRAALAPAGPARHRRRCRTRAARSPAGRPRPSGSRRRARRSTGSSCSARTSRSRPRQSKPMPLNRTRTRPSRRRTWGVEPSNEARYSSAGLRPGRRRRDDRPDRIARRPSLSPPIGATCSEVAGCRRARSRAPREAARSPRG